MSYPRLFDRPGDRPRFADWDELSAMEKGNWMDFFVAESIGARQAWELDLMRISLSERRRIVVAVEIARREALDSDADFAVTRLAAIAQAKSET